MSKNLRHIHLTATLFLGVALVLSGCKSSSAPGVRNSDGSITNADGSVTYPAGTVPQATPAPVARLNPDGSTTNPDGSVTYPPNSTRAKAEKAAPAPAKVVTAPAPAPKAPPPPPEPIAIVIPSGTPVHVSLTESLSASKNEVGDRFSGVLSQPITTAAGARIFDRGTSVSGVVSASKGKGRFKGAGDLAIELTSIGRTRVSTTDYEAVSKGRGKRTAGIIGGGTGLGALIGGLAGGGKGALIGGLAGAGAGTAGAAYTGGRDVVIPSESNITFRLTDSATVR
ncbi:MAG: hypothetical protein ABI197_09925 [Granulicella sp.]